MKVRRTSTVRIILASALLAIGLAPAVSAQTTVWKKVRGWDVSFYPSLEGCTALKVFDGGFSFFIGFDFSITEPTLDVTLMNDNWGSIEDGKEYEIKVYFGDETPWTLQMDGTDFDGTPGLTFYVDAFDDQTQLFIDEFQREASMEWMFGSRSLGKFSLSGSTAAFQEVLACQSSFLEAREKLADPFAGSSSGQSSDPFADQ